MRAWPIASALPMTVPTTTVSLHVSESLVVLAVHKADTMKLVQVVVATLTALAAVGPFMQQVRFGRQPKIHSADSSMLVQTVTLVTDVAKPLHGTHVFGHKSATARKEVPRTLHRHDPCRM
jgi:hypothetical protein